MVKTLETLEKLETRFQYIPPEIARLIAENKLPKVLLITGCNNNLLAQELANYILGQNTVDLIILGDNQEKITIDEIRGLLDQAQQTAYLNNYKVFILLNVENMGVAASNSLLKTLESPNTHNYFILTTNNISKLLATLTSRCYKINAQFTVEQTTTWLTRNNVPSNEQQVLLELAGYSPIKAIDYYNKGYLSKLNEITKLLANLTSISLMQTCNAISDLFKITKNKKEFNILEFLDVINYAIVKSSFRSGDQSKQNKTLELIKHYRYNLNNNLILDNVNIVYKILYSLLFCEGIK